MLGRAEANESRADARRAIGIGEDDRLLALFPGSRPQEIALHLDLFVATARELQRRDPGLQVVVSAAPHVRIPLNQCPFPTVTASSFRLLRAADAAMCKSGTTTLEAAVALCPMVVAYRTDAITYAIASRVVKIDYIGLVNVVAGRLVAPEFIQHDLVPTKVADALEPLLDRATPVRQAMVDELARVRGSLGEAGAATRVAAIALSMAGASPSERAS